MEKKGNILTENIIFIVLNLIFLSILIGFIVLQGAGKIILEQNYAKQIALLIDSASSDSSYEIKLDMQSAFDSKDKNFPWGDVVKISENSVTVKLNEKTEAKYYFFNNLIVNAYPDSNKENLDNSYYIIKIEPVKNAQ